MTRWQTLEAAWPLIFLIAGVVAAPIAYLATRESRRRSELAQTKTINAYEQAIAAQDVLAETASRQLVVMTQERDAYRRDLHAEREHSQALKLEVQKLELRPDINQLYAHEMEWHAERQKFYVAMAESQERIIKALEVLVKKLEMTGRL